jgi:hypothetical protein
MTPNPRHSSISTFTDSPVGRESKGVPLYGRRTDTLGALARITRTNVTLSARFGEAYPAYLAFPAVLSANQRLWFHPVEGI